MVKYISLSITDLGSVAELTLSAIYKHAGTGDVIVIGTEAPISVPGGSVI